VVRRSRPRPETARARRLRPDVQRAGFPVSRPFSAAPLLAYLGARAIPGVESVGRLGYRRSVSVGGRTGSVAVDLREAEAHGVVSVEWSRCLDLDVEGVHALVTGLIDADAPVDDVAASLERDPGLARLVQMYPGARVPGTIDPFELSVRAIVGQQVSIAAARTFAGRIVDHWGGAVDDPDPDVCRAFPGAARLATAPLERIGLSRARAAAVRSLAAAVSSDELVLRAGSDNPSLPEKALLAIKGVGPWTASYVALRGLRNRDAIPIGDLGLRQALGYSQQKEVAQRADAWSPWRGYAAVYLWTTFLVL
jgi:AraC family transcriptional regulator, regulatory protein of adaptative response / DNA-3-methyladenine glycosylase II